MKFRILIAAACLCLLAVVSRKATAQEVVTLKFAHFLPAVSNFHQQVLLPWCAAIEKDSAGRLKCQAYPSMQLGGTPPQLVDQVINGVADIVWTAPSYTAGRFPVIEATELPFVMPQGGLSGSHAMWEFFQAHAQSEFAAVKVLAVFSGGGQMVHTARNPVLDLAGFKGVRLRVSSRMGSKLIAAFGGSPISMPPPQITEAVSKGVIDGALAAWELVPSVKLDEVAPYHFELAPDMPSFSANALMIMMNKQRYDALPADLRAIIDRHSGLPLVERAGIAWDTASAKARAAVIAAGQRVAQVSPAEFAAMRAAASSIEAEWVRDMTAKGADGAALAAAAHAIGALHLGEPQRLTTE